MIRERSTAHLPPSPPLRRRGSGRGGLFFRNAQRSTFNVQRNAAYFDMRPRIQIQSNGCKQNAERGQTDSLSPRSAKALCGGEPEERARVRASFPDPNSNV